MKNILFCAIYIFSSLVFAQDLVVKECTTVIKFFDPPATMVEKFRIIRSENSYLLEETKSMSGVTNVSQSRLSVKEESVRQSLNLTTNSEGLNLAESRIVHAMKIYKDSLFNDTNLFGFDFKKIRSAKIYIIGGELMTFIINGEPNQDHSPLIVELHDSNNKILGSFYSGFQIEPCR